ncbi:BTAD domain-containing putative transcriptional regulator [Streptomyces coelicoflavus]|uniref:BTAD domain-containing putative transcriptional regulator n=1 Tax=Streptomyces coelicoflavus TaxID=285562 RepID=UPI0033231056
MNAIDDHTMWYGMLGPVVVRHGRTSLDLGPRQRRLLLTRLLIEDGRPVSLTELCHSLWGDEQPTAAVSSIRAHISRLRSVLDPDRKSRSSVLISGAAGYTLAVPREARDTTTFEAHVLRARAAFAREQLPLARAEIDTALGLWRGPALGEAAEEPFALREGARPNAARQDAGELLAAILIAQGDLVPAVSVAEQLTVGAPLREVSWSLLMRALYAAGRPVEALRQYDRFRTTLARELGLDPSPGLRDLHMAVLRHDTAALGIPRSPRTPTTLAGIPPVARTPLVGRSQETARLQTLLGEATAGQSRWAVVSGEPGSGKTRLLDEFAAQAAKAGFAVTRASGGHALGRGRTVTLRCAVTQLADGLRGSGEDGGAQDGPGEDVLTTLVRQIARVPTLCVVDIAVLEHPDGRLEAGPPLEIAVHDERPFFDYEAKHVDAETSYTIPAQLDDDVAKQLQRMAVDVFEALNCSGLIRVAFFLRDGVRPVVNEVNTFPGFTAASQFPRIWAAAGLSYGRLLDTLITTAITRTGSPVAGLAAR